MQNVQKIYAKKMQIMPGICRFWWYYPIMHVICKICKNICTICKICKRHFQYAENALPTLLMPFQNPIENNVALNSGRPIGSDWLSSCNSALTLRAYKMSKIKNFERSNFGQSFCFRAQNALCGNSWWSNHWATGI